jgi:hypothetical protein
MRSLVGSVGVQLVVPDSSFGCMGAGSVTLQTLLLYKPFEEYGPLAILHVQYKIPPCAIEAPSARCARVWD